MLHCSHAPWKGWTFITGPAKSKTGSTPLVSQCWMFFDGRGSIEDLGPPFARK